MSIGRTLLGSMALASLVVAGAMVIHDVVNDPYSYSTPIIAEFGAEKVAEIAPWGGSISPEPSKPSEDQAGHVFGEAEPGSTGSTPPIEAENSLI